MRCRQWYLLRDGLRNGVVVRDSPLEDCARRIHRSCVCGAPKFAWGAVSRLGLERDG